MSLDDWICAIENAPTEVDAGTEFMLTVRVVGPRKHDLGGASVCVRDQQETEIARGALTKADDTTYLTDEIVVTAPRSVGEHAYRAVLMVAHKDGASHERAAAAFSFNVKAHAARLNLWDVPSAIVAGERFRFTVGMKCSAGCNLAGRGLKIVDGEGREIAAASLGADIWPGTEALYCTEVEVEAPPVVGTHTWEVTAADWDSGLPHAGGSVTLAVKTVGLPDCEVTIEAIDKDMQTPIKGARVVMHPYRAVTDENGIAKVKVVRGDYDILVSGSKYLPVCTAVEVMEDMISKAELTLEPPSSLPDEVLVED